MNEVNYRRYQSPGTHTTQDIDGSNIYSNTQNIITNNNSQQRNSIIYSLDLSNPVSESLILTESGQLKEECFCHRQSSLIHTQYIHPCKQTKSIFRRVLFKYRVHYMHSYVFPNFQGHGSRQQVNDKQQSSINMDYLQKLQ